MNNPFSLENKKILIVGASSGIGRSIAIECARMGAHLILAARRAEQLAETQSMLLGEGHSMITMDITQADDRNNLISQLPTLDGVALSVGLLSVLPLAYCTDKKNKEMFELNYFSQVELLRLLQKKKKILAGGSIALLSSIGGREIFATGNFMYGSSKAALSSFMKYAAKEYAVRGIRINSINPGMVETGMIDISSFSDEQRQMDIQQYPLGRYGKPEDVAYAAVYLLSDASSWMTGHELILDGGRSI